LTAEPSKASAGRVGRAHGLDGSFYVDDPTHTLAQGTRVTLAGEPRTVDRRAGTDRRPIVHVQGVSDRDAAAALRGQELLVEGGDLDEGEYRVADLVGCRVDGLGEVRRVIAGPSCDVLEVGEQALLVPFIADAVKRVDLDRRTIDVDLDFLALEDRAVDCAEP
jgi:16S rRNA processing protein RimM